MIVPLGLSQLSPRWLPDLDCKLIVMEMEKVPYFRKHLILLVLMVSVDVNKAIRWKVLIKGTSNEESSERALIGYME